MGGGAVLCTYRPDKEIPDMTNVGLSEHFTYRKLIRFVLPCVTMMIVTSVYCIVDGFFVSNCAGKNAFTALNLIYPVLMALGALGFMIGTGGSALVAFTLGEGRKERANQIFTMLILVLTGAGAVLSMVGFIWIHPIALALGATPAIVEDCVIYGRILLASNVFFMLQNSYQSFLVTAERANMGLGITVASGIMNIIMDFVLVYLLDLGIAGAALATAASQIVGAVIPTIYFLRPNNRLLRFTRTRLDLSALGKACMNGASEMMTNLSTSVVTILYNFQLMRFAGEDGVAAYGIIAYVAFIFMALFFGYAVGCNPLVGFNYGAGRKKELRNLFSKSLSITGIAAIVITFLAVWFATPLAKMFVGYDPALCEMTAGGLKIYSLSFLLCGFNIFGSAFFTGLGNGKLSALISFLRTLVLQIAAVLTLPEIFGMVGVWWAVVVAEALTLLVTVFLFAVNRTKYLV